MARVTHFEIPADNVDRAQKFYSAVFGWEFSQWGEEQYWMIKTGDDEKPGINGGLAPRMNPPLPVVNTADVENIDETIEKVKANGGKITMEKMAVPGIGWLIYFMDTEGNLHGAMQVDSNAK